MWIPCFIPLYSPLNLYLIILWILDFKYILLLYSVCLRELEKKSTKIKQIQKFSFNFLGGEVSRLYQILRILFIDCISLINFIKRLPIRTKKAPTSRKK